MPTPIDLSDFDLNAGKIVELNIDGKVFSYKLTTNEDEMTWAPLYMENVDGKVKANVGKMSYCRLRNIVKVPYSKEQIFAVIGEDKEYEQLGNEKKLEFISKLSGVIVGKLIVEISKAESSDSDLKKN